MNKRLKAKERTVISCVLDLSVANFPTNQKNNLLKSVYYSLGQMFIYMSDKVLTI